MLLCHVHPDAKLPTCVAHSVQVYMKIQSVAGQVLIMCGEKESDAGRLPYPRTQHIHLMRAAEPGPFDTNNDYSITIAMIDGCYQKLADGVAHVRHQTAALPLVQSSIIRLHP